MNLKDAQDALLAKCKDYHTYHAKVLKTLNLADEVTLMSYLEQVSNDPVEWFNAFPMVDCGSMVTLAKAKSAILYLIEKHQKTRDTCGVEFCNKLAKTIADVWKENKEELLRIRQEAKLQKDEDDVFIELPEPELQQANNVDIMIIDNKTKKPAKGKSNAEYLDKLAALEEENNELTATTEEAIATITQLQTQNKALQARVDELEKNEKKVGDELFKAANTLTELKDLLIELMRDKGATEVEIKILTRLLPKV